MLITMKAGILPNKKDIIYIVSKYDYWARSGIDWRNKFKTACCG